MLVSLMAWWLSPFMSMGLMPTFELVGKDYSYFILVFTQLRCRKDHVCINDSMLMLQSETGRKSLCLARWLGGQEPCFSICESAGNTYKVCRKVI